MQADDSRGAAGGEAIGQCAEGDWAGERDCTVSQGVRQRRGGGRTCNGLSHVTWLYFSHDEIDGSGARGCGTDVVACDVCGTELRLGRGRAQDDQPAGGEVSAGGCSGVSEERRGAGYDGVPGAG